MLEIKNIIIEKKKGLNGLINRLDTAKERKERISEPEVTSLEILQTEMQREKKKIFKKRMSRNSVLDNAEESDKFVETNNLPRLSQIEINNLIRPITCKETESVIKNFPTNKSPGADGFTGELYQIFKEELIPILLKLFQKHMRGLFQTNFMRPELP